VPNGHEKVWFITGSSRGLGRAIVEAALEAGERVIATARKRQQLDDLVRKYGERLFPLALDFTNNDQALDAVLAGQQHFGGLDVVVARGGIGSTHNVCTTQALSTHTGTERPAQFSD
jgi:NAD(P)-dependent dehydrogenase (short-subunit alcohol dehydrogenase family)